MSYNTFQTSKTIVELPRKGGCIPVQPFGDIHRDSNNCDVDKWQTFLKRAEDTDTPTTRYLGMGDYLDMASFTERKKMLDIHDSTKISLDNMVMIKIKDLCKELSFMKGKLLGLLHGNHEWIFNDGRMSTQVMCEILECPFLGYASYVRVIGKLGSTSASIDIFCSHGKGGGQLVGSPYNTVEKMNKIFSNADIYLMGHDHKKGAVSSTVLQINNRMQMSQKRQWYGRTGSFLRGWITDEPSYCIPAMYAPTDLGTIRFECNMSRVRKSGLDCIRKDVHCIS